MALASGALQILPYMVLLVPGQFFKPVASGRIVVSTRVSHTVDDVIIRKERVVRMAVESVLQDPRPW